MTPELEAELWSKLIRWAQRNQDRSIEIRAIGHNVHFGATAAGGGEPDHAVVDQKHTDALRRFVGKLQGNRS